VEVEEDEEGDEEGECAMIGNHGGRIDRIRIF